MLDLAPVGVQTCRSFGPWAGSGERSQGAGKFRSKTHTDPSTNPDQQQTIHMRILPVSLLFGLFLAACSSAPELSASVDTGPESSTMQVETVSSDAGYRPEGHTYTIITTSLIDSSQAPALEEMAAIASEQAAFVDWLHMNAGLAAAGPVVAPHGKSAVRQLMFFDSSESDMALERCCEGPAIGTGLYENVASRFVTTADLSRVRDFVVSGSGNAIRRPYVMVTGPSSLAMKATIGKMGPMVLCVGDCIDGAFAGRCMAILDCTDMEDARMFMGEVCPEADNLSYHGWVGPVAFSMAR